MPFWGPRQLLEGSIDTAISTPHAVAVGLAYTALLLGLTFALAFRRLRVARTHDPVPTCPVSGGHRTAWPASAAGRPPRSPSQVASSSRRVSGPGALSGPARRRACRTCEETGALARARRTHHRSGSSGDARHRLRRRHRPARADLRSRALERTEAARLGVCPRAKQALAFAKTAGTWLSRPEV